MVRNDSLPCPQVTVLKNSLTIAGGGLAGLSLAIALRRHEVDVTVHEAGNYPRHRVCGEFISGVTESTLERLGISDALQSSVHLSSASWSDRHGQIREMQVTGRGISRWRLDDTLQQQFVALGGKIITRSRTAPGPGTIWAAGRPRQDGPWIGLKCHSRDMALSHDLEMHLGTNGYLGLAKIEDGKINICGLFRKPVKPDKKNTHLLIDMVRRGGLDQLARRLESASLDESSFCGVAGFITGRQPSTGFSIGDATHMIPPFTGNGMSMAFQAAETALPHALSYARGATSWDAAAADCSSDLESRFRTRMIASAGIHPILTSARGTATVSTLTRTRLLPIQPLLHLLR